VTVGTWLLEVRIHADRLPVPGDLIELTLDQTHLHFFEVSTGEAIPEGPGTQIT
jgi:hypothetical protein